MMRKIFYFLITCLVSTGALLGNLHSPHPMIGFAVVFGVWALYILGCSYRLKKKAQKDFNEQRFRNYMRMQYRKSNR